MSSKSRLDYRVPMSSPDLTDAEREAVAAVLATRHLSMGPKYEEFEGAIGDYTGRKHAIAVNSGTAGLHLCVRAAQISPGDLVITTPFSFVASSNVILYEAGVPVFVDVDAHTGNMDVLQLKQAVEELAAEGAASQKWLPRRWALKGAKLKAVMPIDVFGQPADSDPILEIAGKHGLKIIEDACEAIGAEYKGRQVGIGSDMAVYAFYPNKQMTTGEGGMIVTDDAEGAEFMRSMRNQGRAPGDSWLEHTHLGYNYRMDEMSAALGVAQLQRLDAMLEKRAMVAGWYSARLEDLPLVKIPKLAATTTKMSWFVYVIRLVSSVDRDGLIAKLTEDGIPARPYFAPIHLQPYMVERFGYQPGDYPVTEDLGRRGLALPFSSVMTEEQVELVCQALGEALLI